MTIKKQFSRIVLLLVTVIMLAISAAIMPSTAVSLKSENQKQIASSVSQDIIIEMNNN